VRSAGKSFGNTWITHPCNALVVTAENGIGGYKLITTKQLTKWIAKWESTDARTKSLFGFLELAAAQDLAVYLEKRINKHEK